MAMAVYTLMVYGSQSLGVAALSKYVNHLATLYRKVNKNSVVNNVD